MPVVDPISIRCSSLPRLAACAASIVPPAVRIEGDREPADLGTAFHAGMVQVVNGNWPDVEALAHEHQAEEEELAKLLGIARKVWNEQLSPLFPEPETELRFEAEDADAGITLTGTSDLVSVADGEIRILDHKSGFLDVDASHQLRGYAMLALLRSPGIDRVSISKWQVRHGELTTEVYTREQLEKWWEWFTAHIRETSIYRTGSHCVYCPRSRECEARRTELQALASIFGGSIAFPSDPYDLAEIVTKARQITKVAEFAVEAIRAEVIAAGGKLGPLEITESERKEIDAARGFEILRDIIGEEKLLEAVRISKKPVEDAIKAGASRGEKGTRVKAVMDQLAEAGALKVVTIKKLEVRNHGIREQQLPQAAGDTAGSDTGV